MRFIDRIRCQPLAYDPARARDTLARLPGFPGPVSDLLHGVAGSSPYLAGLMEREAVWLEDALTGDPETALALLLEPAADGPPAAVGVGLRQQKRRLALLTALADCGGVWSLAEVTGALTDFADKAVAAALRTELAPLLAAGKLPGQGPDDLALCGGLAVLAMGKTGARELNYSSDIDLICLFDDSRYGSDILAEARMVLARVVRRAMALLSERTADGYVFRTDLRLRPDPSVTSVAVAISAAERYYESLGRTWERAAYIKARPAAGDIPAAETFLRTIRPFIWRRHLDFATVEDTQAMQARIRAEKQTWDGSVLDGRDLKLGPGGIREIEFFTQTRQMIAGGRDRRLRVRGTCDGLARLAEAGWMPSEAAAGLIAAYGKLRSWEHRLQMIQDAQTHDLPRDAEGWDRLARFLGEPDTTALRAEMLATFDEVQALTAPIFEPRHAPGPGLAAHLPDLAERWRSFPALRTERARAILTRLLPELVARFDRAARPEEALTQFERFLAGLPAGVQVFALFEANPQLIDLMVDIASTAPALAEYLSRNAHVLDSVIDGHFFAPWPGMAPLAEDLGRILALEGDDYERGLDAARRWHKDWHFRIGVHHLRGLIDAPEAAAQYSDLAEAVLRGLWPLVAADIAQRHGPMPGQGAVVLGMGSIGARALTAGSDLDLIVIYDAPGEPDSTGPKPLPARTYYARLTKALVTALSVGMAEGTLYEVDMRLRPSGRQGPVATSWSAFQSYQQSEAWVWEHMALLRARVVAGSPALAAEVDGFRAELLGQKAEPSRVLAELADMRGRLAAAKPRQGPWDTDNGPGGRQDIELFAAAGALVAGLPLCSVADQLAAAPLVQEASASLARAHDLFLTLKQLGALLCGGSLDIDQLGQGGCDMLLRETGAETLEALDARIGTELADSARQIDGFMALAQD